MTALAAPVGLRTPAPRLLRWLVRLHRPALYVWTALVVALAALLLWLWGPLTDAAADAWKQFDACRTEACSYDQASILRYKDVYTYTTYPLLALPFTVAAWAGASLVGREMEHGTAHLAWTQGVTPVRWLTAKLAAPAVLVTAGTGLLVLLHRLAWSAGEGRIDTAKPWYSLETFYANGPVPVALALAGLVAGALAGLVLGRTLAALGTGLAATALLWAGAHLAMPHLWPTVTSVAGLRNNGAPGAGIQVASGLLTADGRRIADPYCGTSLATECSTLYDRLHAVSYYKDFHPASQYWPLQFMTAGLLLVAAALLAAVTFRLLRRRTAVARTVRSREEATV
ncbi:ABC transporter permease [Streptomyces sp. CA-249302]|uniref:ABC transporter permease n=1 Tax=Streptomyces sp. CA-249302 TaxID=3240058 RepID=UPI003D90CB9C